MKSIFRPLMPPAALTAARSYGVVQVEPGHARLDDGVGEFRVDLQDAVHLLEADLDRAAHAR
ncbi:hypothetical protein [Streptomyces sp. T028]|uniref:hypothetical protein n=1 Tax=Streptomyces sp. T028 TaxID=3394379 RepID=UPI003A8A8B9B